MAHTSHGERTSRQVELHSYSMRTVCCQRWQPDVIIGNRIARGYLCGMVGSCLIAFRRGAFAIHEGLRSVHVAAHAIAARTFVNYCSPVLLAVANLSAARAT